MLCLCYATATFLLFFDPCGGSTLSRIIGHPFHTPPWSNEAQLNANIKVMEERRQRERDRFDRLHPKEVIEKVAITVTESPERSEVDMDTPDTKEINFFYNQRERYAKFLDLLSDEVQMKKAKRAKNITGGNVLIENFYMANENGFYNSHTFTTSTTTMTPSTSTLSTLIYTLRYGFVFEHIVGLISTSPTPKRDPPPRSTEIWPWNLWYSNQTFGDDEVKRLWQMNRFTPFLYYFTDPDYQELTTTPIMMNFSVSWEYSDDPCDRQVPYEERHPNYTTTPKDYDSFYRNR